TKLNWICRTLKHKRQMRDYLFSVNKENAYSLQKKFSLDEDETEYLHRNFWPIITLTEIEVDEFQGLLNKEKSEFRKKRGRFVIELFKRDYLDFLIDELNSYLDNINRRRNKIYNVVSDTYFHWFKLEADIKTYTLLLSKKDELNLEIYFIDLLDVIKSFISENETLPPQQTEKPKPELTINQIALKYVYSEIQITRENGNKIAKEYGHNSGEKLFQRFTYYSSAANRK